MAIKKPISKSGDYIGSLWLKGILFLTLLMQPLSAQEAPRAIDKVTANDWSPNRDILVENYFFRDGTAQIWLVSVSDPLVRRLLFTYNRHATVLFSTNQEWLVINYHPVSNASEVLLFRHNSGLNYSQVAELSRSAWDFFAARNAKDPQFDHRYVDAIRWVSDDPAIILLCLEGRRDSRNHTENWLCLYDVQAKKFSTDVDAQNKKNTTIE